MSARSVVLSMLFLASFGNSGDAAQAQQTSRAREQGGAVPRELVVAIIGGSRMTGPVPELFVGRLPDGFPAELLPPKPLDILGGVRYPAQMPFGTRTTTIAVIRSNPDSALAAMHTAWVRSGWQHPYSGNPAMGGFITSPVTRPNLFYCTDSAFLTASTTPRAAGGSYVRVDLTTGQRSTPCSPQPVRPLPQYPDIRMPTLVAPLGVKLSDNASSGSGWAREASTILETDMSPAELVAHYANQLTEQGWTLSAPATTSNAVLQTAEKKDSKGGAQLGILSAYTMPRPGNRGVSFRIVSDADRPERGL